MKQYLSIGVVVLAVLVALAGLTLWLTLDPGPPEPSGADWAAARDVIKNEFRPGDGIRVHPFWLSDAAAVLAGAGNGGHRPGLIDLSLPPDPFFVHRHKRLWVVSAMERKDAVVPSDLALTFEKKVAGAIAIRRYDVPGLEGFVDLLGQLKSARVERWVGKSNPRKCRWNGKHHACGGRNWENVGVEHKQVGGSPRRCIVLHPYPNRGTVALTFPKVKLAAGLLFRLGFTLEAARRDAGSDVKFSVYVDNSEVIRHTEKKNAWRWTSLFVDTRKKANELASVRLEANAEKEAWRELCVDAYVLPPGLADRHR